MGLTLNVYGFTLDDFGFVIDMFNPSLSFYLEYHLF